MMRSFQVFTYYSAISTLCLRAESSHQDSKVTIKLHRHRERTNEISGNGEQSKEV